MITKITSTAIGLGGIKPKFLKSLLLSLVLFGTALTSNAQSSLIECHHLQAQYQASPNYFAFGIYNNSNLYSTWDMTITNATYILDETQFSNQYNIGLNITSTTNPDGTYNYSITPDDTLYPYEYLNWIYQGNFLDSEVANFTSDPWDIMCLYDESQLCNELGFNYFIQDQNTFGFEVQNNSSLDINTFEVYIDDAPYALDLNLLNYSGYDLTVIDNGDGTYDYIFVNQAPIQAYSPYPAVTTSQSVIGGDTESSGATINCQLTPVSSGNNGGLESHGGLASKIALRNFKKSVGISTDPLFKVDNSVVADLAPTHILSGDSRVESSPTDLIAITAAETVWAGDYYINNTRFASVFGTKTENEVYDHTKVICDRVKGSELVSVEVVSINGYDAIMSVIRRPNDFLEYAISFSLAFTEYGKFEFVSKWAIDEYEPSPNFLNYQVWTNNKSKSIKAVQHILDNVVSQNGFELTAAAGETNAPQLYATKAYYKLGKFHLELHNDLIGSTTVDVRGKCFSKEVDGEEMPFTKEIILAAGQTSVEIELPFGNIFDGEIEIATTNSTQKDAIYLADGSWGLEYNDVTTSLNKFEIIPDKRTEENGAYIVERGISVSGSTNSYISIFKQLVPGGMAVDLTQYNTLSFDCKSQGVYEVSLLTAGNTDPSKNLTYTLNAKAGEEVNIPFNYFTNADGEMLNASDVTTIYIAYQADNNDEKDFSMEIENVRFKNDDNSNFGIYTGGLDMYPNPSTGAVRLTHLFNDRTEALVTVYNAKGSTVKQFTQTAFKGLQNIDISLDNQEQGVYLISLQTNEGIFSNSVLIMK